MAPWESTATKKIDTAIKNVAAKHPVPRKGGRYGHQQ